MSDDFRITALRTLHADLFSEVDRLYTECVEAAYSADVEELSVIIDWGPWNNRVAALCDVKDFSYDKARLLLMDSSQREIWYLLWHDWRFSGLGQKRVDEARRKHRERRDGKRS